MDRGGWSMTEIIFRCKTPDVIVRLYNIRPIPIDNYECISFNLEIRTNAFKVQKHIDAFLSELKRLSSDLMALMEGETESLRLSFLGEFFYLELNRRDEGYFILKCEITCYEETSETNFETEGILKSDDLALLHHQVGTVLNSI